MISHEDIKNLVSEWSLREDIIEKDYVIGWILWGIGSDPDVGLKWAFKGGTCIKKCYIETYRFSEDLDFTVLPGGPIKLKEISSILDRILKGVTEESGIDFSLALPKIKQRESPLSVEARIYYRGPRNTPTPASIKLDLTALEKVVCPSVLCKIAHPYPDKLPNPDRVRCYTFEEVFAEKIRAMGERGRPRDLYDIINLFRRETLQSQPKYIKSILIKKCKTKGVSVPNYKLIKDSPYHNELRSEWKNMLGHQLQVLPPLEQFWEELPHLFDWLEGTYVPKILASLPIRGEEDTTWVPPSTIYNWELRIPIESIRFAAVNHLCIELEYRKKGHDACNYLIEPYSLRRTKKNNLVLHAIKTETQEHRTFRVDWIENVKVSSKSFFPKFQIEFSPIGPIETLPIHRSKSKNFLPKLEKARNNFGPTYIFECLYCGRKFKKIKYNAKLRPHKDKSGENCPGRIGHLVDTYHN